MGRRLRMIGPRAAAAVLLGALAGLFGTVAILFLVEVVGPSQTSEGLVLDRSSFEWTRRVCGEFGRRSGRSSGADPCVTTVVPSGSVAGQRPDGSVWSVIGEAPYDAAGPTGSVLSVTTSSVTGRVVAIDNPDRFDGHWSRAGSGEHWVVIAFGLVVGGALIALTAAGAYTRGLDRRGAWLVGGLLTVTVTTAAAVAVWRVTTESGRYAVPTAANRYGELVADPYGFAASAPAAIEDGWAHRDRGGAVVRVVRPDEAGPIVETLDLDRTTTVVLVGADRGAWRSTLTVTADGPDGEAMEASRCVEGWEFPTVVAGDESVAAGVWCFPEPITDGHIDVAVARFTIPTELRLDTG